MLFTIWAFEFFADLLEQLDVLFVLFVLTFALVNSFSFQFVSNAFHLEISI